MNGSCHPATSRGPPPTTGSFDPTSKGCGPSPSWLVVLYHADVLRITGGYVGVDVFFVISGFVITGLLLRERSSTNTTSLLSFYARRVRRILPAATLVILVTVFFSYVYPRRRGGQTLLPTTDGGPRRFSPISISRASGTNYLTASLPPSPLQNYWSLSVEEQFYLVFPTLFLLVARAKGTLSLQKRMTVVLIGVIVLSFGLSVIQTASSPAAAYFSPFTRAWELALGGLIAVSTSHLRKLPVNIAGVMTWLGLGMIVASAFTFNTLTAYPGSAVAVPVLGAGLVIAGGVVARGHGAELALGTRPFQWLGRRSYGWYLVHWPILIIVTEAQDKAMLPGWESLLLIVGALGVAAALYRLVEDPVRHLRTPRLPTVVVGGITVVVTVLVLSAVITWHAIGFRYYPVVPAPDVATVESNVAAAPSIVKLPRTVEPSVEVANEDFGGNFEPGGCIAAVESYDATDLHSGRQQRNQSDGRIRGLTRADVAACTRFHRQEGPPPTGRPLPLVLPVSGGHRRQSPRLRTGRRPVHRVRRVAAVGHPLGEYSPAVADRGVKRRPLSGAEPGTSAPPFFTAVRRGRPASPTLRRNACSRHAQSHPRGHPGAFPGTTCLPVETYRRHPGLLRECSNGDRLDQAARRGGRRGHRSRVHRNDTVVLFGHVHGGHQELHRLHGPVPRHRRPMVDTSSGCSDRPSSCSRRDRRRSTSTCRLRLASPSILLRPDCP